MPTPETPIMPNPPVHRIGNCEDCGHISVLSSYVGARSKKLWWLCERCEPEEEYGSRKCGLGTIAFAVFLGVSAVIVMVQIVGAFLPSSL